VHQAAAPRQRKQSGPRSPDGEEALFYLTKHDGYASLLWRINFVSGSGVWHVRNKLGQVHLPVTSDYLLVLKRCLPAPLVMHGHNACFHTSTQHGINISTCPSPRQVPYLLAVQQGDKRAVEVTSDHNKLQSVADFAVCSPPHASSTYPQPPLQTDHFSLDAERH
jgi:hypothetical protein